MTRSVFTFSNYAKLAGLLLIALATVVVDLKADREAQAQSAASANLPQIVFVQAPKAEEARGGETRFPEGSRIVLLVRSLRDRKPVVLTADFFAAADPQVHFTGKRILFAAQRARGDYWQVWEMNLEGQEARQITTCQADCVRPAYLSAEEIAFTRVATESGRPSSTLQVAGLDGSNVRAVTFGPGDWWLETVLRDGRILASANSPLNVTARSRLLYTVRPDGTGLESLRCDHGKSANRGEATELEDGAVVFAEDAGALMAIKRGALREERIGRPGVSYRTPGVAGGNSIFVAMKPGNAPRYELATISADGRGEARTIYSDPQFDAVEPVAVQERPVPKRFWSNLILSSASGYFISLDSSNSVDQSNVAASARSVRVLALKRGGEIVLGEAPVESDGSFYLRVPANQPVRFVLLDEQGRAIREERSWVWTRPGEQRGCTGCHGEKALAPENRWPLALKRKDPPALLSGEKATEPTGENRGH